jgi:hypothetical protein
MRNLFFLSLFCTLSVFAQKKNEAFQYHIFEAKGTIKIDGLENDAAWQQTELAKDFHMVTPMDTSLARNQTEMRLCYDKNNLYIIKPSKAHSWSSL